MIQVKLSDIDLTMPEAIHKQLKEAASSVYSRSEVYFYIPWWEMYKS